MNDLERLARDLAFWHGQNLVYKTPEGKSRTRAQMHGGQTPEEYSQTHWREYDECAQYVMEMLLLERKKNQDNGR